MLKIELPALQVIRVNAEKDKLEDKQIWKTDKKPHAGLVAEPGVKDSVKREND